MKQINVWFEDSEHKLFQEMKDKVNLNWHDFLILLLTHSQDSVKKKNLEPTEIKEPPYAKSLKPTQKRTREKK